MDTKVDTRADTKVVTRAATKVAKAVCGKGRFGHPKGKGNYKGNYATAIGTYQHWYAKAQGMDISDVIVTAERNQTRPEEHRISTPRQLSGLEPPLSRRLASRTFRSSSTIRQRFTLVSISLCEGNENELIVDPGAASGLVDS